MKIGAFLLLLFILTQHIPFAQDQSLSLNGFSQWRTGHDENTMQLIPGAGNDGLVKENGMAIVHVKFKVMQYGEVSFPINQKSKEGEEPLPANLSKSKYVQITYHANQRLILQLRQTGAHGGIHNHVNLAACKKETTVVIPFKKFKGGKTPLDLSDVSKFNFAFLSNGKKDDPAELRISNVTIDNY
jgi:hypothetical protein